MMQTSHTHLDNASHGFSVTEQSIHVSVQSYIETKYLDCYHADIDCTYDNILFVTNQYGQYVAAVGYRPPEDVFFLEQYFEEDAETTISKLYGESIKRKHLVEIGNLVGDNKHAVFFLMQELWRHLERKSYRHVFLTCTKKLQRRFRNLPLTKITDARKENVRNSENWGSYYENSPLVMTGKLSSYDHRFNLKRKNSNFIIGHSSVKRSSL